MARCVLFSWDLQTLQRKEWSFQSNNDNNYASGNRKLGADNSPVSTSSIKANTNLRNPEQISEILTSVTT
jgi:hypothetical protein